MCQVSGEAAVDIYRGVPSMICHLQLGSLHLVGRQLDGGQSHKTGGFRPMTHKYP